MAYHLPKAVTSFKQFVRVIRFPNFCLGVLMIALLMGASSHQMKAQAFNVQIGTGTIQNLNTGFPAPYGNWYWGARNQYLILASELLTAGAAPGFISSVGFDVVQFQGEPLTDFTIKIGATSATSLAVWETGLTTVYGPATYTESNGWNTHNFSNMFLWDGNSNIVIETCFNNGSFTYNAVVRQSTTPFSSARVFWQDATGVCQNTSVGTAYSQRPNMQLGVSSAHQVDVVMRELLTPETKCGLDNVEPIKVVLQYFGTLTLPIGTPIEMRAILDNQPPIIEHLILTQPFTIPDTLHYTFNSTLDLSLEKPYNLRVIATVPGDGNPSNDVIDEEVRNNFLNEFPVVSNFEDWGAKSTVPSCNVVKGVMRDGWMQPKTDDGSWLVGQGPTPNQGTGPSYDFSEKSINGKYLYINSANPCDVVGKTYLLQSACMDISQLQNPGLNFAYYMNGATMGALRVEVIRLSDGYVFPNAWTRAGNQGNKWHTVVFPLSQYQQEGIIQVQFKASSGSGSEGDIAIDDLRIGELPVFDLGSGTIQDCGTLVLDTKIDGGIYSWSTGETSRAITIKNTTQQTLNLKVGVMVEKNGLYYIDSVNIALAPGPVVDLGPDPTLLCNATSLMLDAGNPGMTFTWDNQSSAQTRTVTESGIYWVQVDNGQGCVKRDSVHVKLEDIPVSTFSYQNVTNFSFIQFTSSGSSSGTYLWEFGDGNTSNQSNPQHYYTSGGQYVVSLTIENECGITTHTQTITVYPTGIDAPASLAGLSVSPNPSEGIFTILLDVHAPGDWALSVTDLQGRIIHQEIIGHVATNTSRTIDLTHTLKGIYLLQLHGPDGVASRQLVVQ